MSPCPEHSDPPDRDFSHDAERLFRRVAETHVRGDHVDAAVVDLRGWSFDRERYRADPADVLRERASELPRIAFTRVDRFDRLADERIVRRVLTLEVRLPGENAAPHCFFNAEVVHVPCAENYAHTEIRVWPGGSSYRPAWPGPGGTSRKIILKEKLASLLRPLDGSDIGAGTQP